MAEAQTENVKKQKVKKFIKLMRLGWASLLFSTTVLIVALLAFLAFSKSANEAKYVDNKQYQAVFLNSPGANAETSDHVVNLYFGKVTSISQKYIRLVDVYYLKQNPNATSSTGNSFSLVKLGCELHGPNDEILFNRDNVVMWENLKSDSQVATKISDFKKQNPNGQKCSQSSTNNQQNTPTTTPKQ